MTAEEYMWPEHDPCEACGFCSDLRCNVCTGVCPVVHVQGAAMPDAAWERHLDDAVDDARALEDDAWTG
jgi:hypothetical protein